MSHRFCTDFHRLFLWICGLFSAYYRCLRPEIGPKLGQNCEVVKPLAELALEISDLVKLTGRSSPTVIT